VLEDEEPGGDTVSSYVVGCWKRRTQRTKTPTTFCHGMAP
jgi:hypothetical protein